MLIVMMTAYGTVSQAVAAIKKGAFDYVQKPFDIDAIDLQIPVVKQDEVGPEPFGSGKSVPDVVRCFHQIAEVGKPQNNGSFSIDTAAGQGTRITIIFHTGGTS